MYLVINSVQHVRQLAKHFDDLIRAAVVQPHEVIPLLQRLLERLKRRRR
jgi:hypothetical protein